MSTNTRDLCLKVSISLGTVLEIFPRYSLLRLILKPRREEFVALLDDGSILTNRGTLLNPRNKGFFLRFSVTDERAALVTLDSRAKWILSLEKSGPDILRRISEYNNR